MSLIIVSLPVSPCSESSVVAHRYFVTAQEWSPDISLYSTKHKHMLLQFPAVLHAPESATTKNYFFLSLLVHSGSGVAVFQNFFTVDSYLCDTAKFMTEEKKSICVEYI